MIDKFSAKRCCPVAIKYNYLVFALMQKYNENIQRFCGSCFGIIPSYIFIRLVSAYFYHILHKFFCDKSYKK